MKKAFQIIGLLSLMSLSFICTEHLALVVKDTDEIMIKIKEEKDNYYKESIDAKIDNNIIIPGLSGLEVDINKSYEKMKKIGKYSPNLLEYKKIYPNISIRNNYDKYIISGNKNKNEISLLFKINNNDISKLKEILDNNKIKATFLIDNNWIRNNNTLIPFLINENYNLIDINNNLMTNKLIKSYNQKNTFCYVEEENEEVLNKCFLTKNYTIKPTLILNNNAVIEIKKNINNGLIIVLDLNDKILNELPLIIKEIKRKDINIVNLVTLLEE